MEKFYSSKLLLKLTGEGGASLTFPPPGPAADAHLRENTALTSLPAKNIKI